MSTADVAQAAEKVVIALRSTATVSNHIILLGDVSDIVTTDQRVQRAFAAIDLAERTPGTSTVTIPRQQIALRLQIAGLAQDSFQLVGAEQVEVFGYPQRSPVAQGWDGRHFEERVLGKLRDELANHWNVPATELEVRLTQPLPKMERNLPVEIDEIDVAFSAEQRSGAMRPRVYLRSKGQLVEVWNLPIEGLHISEVVVAKKSVAPGDELNTQNVDVVRRPIRQAHQTISLERALGTVARRPIQPGQVVHAYDVKEKPREKNYAIRRRDVVQLVARKGSLLVTVTNAEAIHDANIGETIRVRNPSSRKIIVGKVVNSSQVQVMY